MSQSWVLVVTHSLQSISSFSLESTYFYHCAIQVSSVQSAVSVPGVKMSGISWDLISHCSLVRPGCYTERSPCSCQRSHSGPYSVQLWQKLGSLLLSFTFTTLKYRHKLLSNVLAAAAVWGLAHSSSCLGAGSTRGTWNYIFWVNYSLVSVEICQLWLFTVTRNFIQRDSPCAHYCRDLRVDMNSC